MSATAESEVKSELATVPIAEPAIRIHILPILGAVLVLVSFFLPWIRFADGTRTLATLSGLQIASGTSLRVVEGAELFRGSPLVLLAPLVGILVLVRVFFAYRREYVTQVDGFVAMGLSLVALILLWVRSGVVQENAEEQGLLLQQLPGLLGTYLALAGLFVSGILYIRAVGKRDPSFRGTLSAWSFMGPASVLVAVFFFLPAIILLGVSLTDLASSNFGNPLTFIGLENYRKLFNDPFFPKILGNTFRYVVFTLGIFNVGLALVLALLTTNIDRRAGFFFRTVWLLPRITPSVIYILMWRRIAHQPPFGIINQLLGPLGVESQYWLIENPWAFVILTNGFVGASFGLIIFSSAIESIPKDYITAAKVDGASRWQIIRDIILPLIRWPLLFVTTYQTLSLLTSFEYILLLTEGGPGLLTTEVWALTAFKRALKTYFGNNQWGYGAAWGFILVIIGVVLTIFYVRVFRFRELVKEPKIDVL